MAIALWIQEAHFLTNYNFAVFAAKKCLMLSYLHLFLRNLMKISLMISWPNCLRFPTFSFSTSSSCKCYLLKAMTWSASKDKQGGTCTFGWNRTKIPLPYKMQLMNIEVRFLTCIQKTAFKFQSLTYYIYIYIIHLYSNIHVGT